MKKKTVWYLWIIIIMFIMILIPYIQNAGAGAAGGADIAFFMGGFDSIVGVYLYIVSMGMIEGALITLFLQSLFQDLQESEPTKFDLNK